MNIPAKKRTREDWATLALNEIFENIVTEQLTQLPTPKFRVSIAPLPPSKLGHTHPRAQSSDNTTEIYIAAHEDDSLKHLETLLKCAVHATDDCQSGHKGHFVHVIRKLGLVGKPTQLHVPRPSHIANELAEIHQWLGDIPHAAMTVKKDRRNPNGFRITCTSPQCNFKANTSRLHYDNAKAQTNIMTDTFTVISTCPVCQSNPLQFTS